MNKVLKLYIKQILLVFLYLQPIIDLITSLSINMLGLSISFGMIIRFVFLLFILYFYLFVKRDKSKYKLIMLGSVLLYLVLFVINVLEIKGNSALFYELSNMLKIFYFVILIILIKEEDIDIKIKDLVNISVIYMVLIAVPSIFNVSYNSYTQGKIGSVGLFNSGNEISAILSILTPFVIYYLFNNKSIIKNIIIIILMLYTYLIMGSKIIIISLIVSLIFNLIINKKINKKVIIPIIILAALSVLILPKTNFYYNIKLHLDFLGINSISDIFSYKFINRFIFSDRLTFLSNTFNNYMNSSLVEKVLGIGFIENYATDYVSLKLIEMDLFDILFRCGIVGFVVYLIPLINKLRNSFNKKDILVKFSLVLSFIISILVGHTLLAPGVAIYIVYLVLSKNMIGR